MVVKTTQFQISTYVYVTFYYFIIKEVYFFIIDISLFCIVVCVVLICGVRGDLLCDRLSGQVL